MTGSKRRGREKAVATEGGSVVSEKSQDLPEKSEEERATSAARWVAAAVLIIGTLLVLVPALAHLGAVIRDDPFRPRQTTETVVTTGPTGKTTTRTTTQEANQSFVERSLAAGGLLLLRIGLVGLAAFLAGAVVQRTLLGNFALKLGPIEIPEVKRTAAASRDAIRRVVRRMDRQENRVAEAMLAAAQAEEGAAALDQRLATVEEGLTKFLGLLGEGSQQEASAKPSEGLDLDVSVELESEDKTDEA